MNGPLDVLPIRQRVTIFLKGVWKITKACLFWEVDNPQKYRTIHFRKQCFVVYLTDGEQLFHHIKIKDLWIDDECWGCESLHDERVSEFLREAGQFGVQINGEFYPHSRIDKIILGGVVSWAEKEGHKNATT